MRGRERLRILALGDVHGRVDAVSRIVAEHIVDPPDAIVLAGDVTPDVDSDGDPAHEPLHRALRLNAFGALVSALAHLDRPILAVPGNHDSPLFDGAGGMINVDVLAGMQPHALHGITVLGIGGSPEAPYYNRHAWNEGTLDAILGGIALDGPAVLVSHTPPAHPALDLSPSEAQYFSSGAVTRFVEREHERIRVCISGHLHRKAGVFRIGNTVAVACGNVCPMRARAAMTLAHEQSSIHPELEQRFLIDIDDEGVSVMHYRRCTRTSETLPVLTTRVALAAGEQRRA